MKLRRTIGKAAIAARPLKAVLTVAGRWRHSKGFGIHSPFAYALVTGVLRDKSRYYSYDLIDAMRRRARRAGKGVLEPSAYKLITRLVSRVDPGLVLVADPTGTVAPWVKTVAPHATIQAVTEGYTTIHSAVQGNTPRPQFSRRTMLVAVGMDSTVATAAQQVLEGEGAVLLLRTSRHDPLLRQLLEAMPCGMSFSSTKRTAVSGLSFLPRQHFDIYF